MYVAAGCPLRAPQPVAQQGIRYGRDSLSGLRHRPQHHDLQHRRRRAAAAVSLRRSRPDPRARQSRISERDDEAACRFSTCATGRRPAPRSRRSPRSQGAALDGVGRRGRARAAPWRRDLLGPVSAARHLADPGPGLHRRRRSAECAAASCSSATRCGLRRYQADPSVLGRSMLVNAKPHTVVGVMPPGFEFPENQRLWIPLGTGRVQGRADARNLFAFGRLKPGVSRGAGDRGADRRSPRGWRSSIPPPTTAGARRSARSVRRSFRRRVAGALADDGRRHARAVHRLLERRQSAARARCRAAARVCRARAIGAGRGRIVRQLLTESVVLGAGERSARHRAGRDRHAADRVGDAVDEVPYYIQWRGRLAVVGLHDRRGRRHGACLRPRSRAAGVAAGTSRKPEGRHPRQQRQPVARSRSSLVVAQVSLALVALVGALLFVRTFVNLDTYNARLRRQAAHDDAVLHDGRRVRAHGREAPARRGHRSSAWKRLPGVQAAFASNLVPITGGGGGGEVEIEGRADRKAGASRASRSPA